jgi:hypothetical protein
MSIDLLGRKQGVIARLLQLLCLLKLEQSRFERLRKIVY